MAPAAAVVIDDLEVWVESHIRVAEKWAGGEAGLDEDGWRARARRAEAEREAARTIAYSSASKLDAHVQHLEADVWDVSDPADVRYPDGRVDRPVHRIQPVRVDYAGTLGTGSLTFIA